MRPTVQSVATRCGTARVPSVQAAAYPPKSASAGRNQAPWIRPLTTTTTGKTMKAESKEDRRKIAMEVEHHFQMALLHLQDNKFHVGTAMQESVHDMVKKVQNWGLCDVIKSVTGSAFAADDPGRIAVGATAFCRCGHAFSCDVKAAAPPRPDDGWERALDEHLAARVAHADSLTPNLFDQWVGLPRFRSKFSEHIIVRAANVCAVERNEHEDGPITRLYFNEKVPPLNVSDELRSRIGIRPGHLDFGVIITFRSGGPHWMPTTEFHRKFDKV